MNTPLFDSDDFMARVPTREDVEEAALHDIVLRHCLAEYRQGRMTYEECLLTAVVWFSKNRTSLLKQLTDARRNVRS